MRIRTAGLALVFLVEMCIAAACGGNTSEQASAPCQPETERDCVCADGSLGVQTCIDDGSAWTSCDCPGGGTGVPPPPYRGASYFQIITDGCNVSAATGFAIPDGQQPTTQVDQGPRVEDGRNGANVSCEVSRSGDGYFISGTLQQGQRSFTVSGPVAPSEDGGHAGLGTVIQVDSPMSLNVGSDPDSCRLTVNPNQDIAEGRVGGNFDCARVADPPNVECEAMGSFVFENCDK